jgi:hypothetical protein
MKTAYGVVTFSNTANAFGGTIVVRRKVCCNQTAGRREINQGSFRERTAVRLAAADDQYEAPP